MTKKHVAKQNGNTTLLYLDSDITLADLLDAIAIEFPGIPNEKLSILVPTIGTISVIILS